ncbi:MAG: PDZ domain-containing protein [Acidobacteriota bacterium]|nr:PDZ domain-containing protein [Acidobacteriota bacterium]
MRKFLPVALWAGMVLFSQIAGAQLGSHLGVHLTEIDSDRAAALKLGDPRGVEIQSVDEGSPAENAGIKAGDVLLSYNGEEILSGPQLGRLVAETPAGRKVKIQYFRDGKTRSTVALLAPFELKAEYPSSDPRSWTVPDFPVMLMLWNNVQLGITCEPVDSQLAQYFGVNSGILIRRMEKGWAADKAGLRVGDVIVRVDTQTVAAPRDLISYLRAQREPVKRIAIVFVRDHKTSTATISLIDR